MRNKVQGILFSVPMVHFGDGNAMATVGFEDACCVQSGNVRTTCTSRIITEQLQTDGEWRRSQ